MAATIPSCIIEDSPAPPTEPIAKRCSGEGCNSPTIDGRLFHDAWQGAHQASTNAAGFHIVDFVKGVTHYTLDVTNGRLSGLNAMVGNLTGGDLKGAQITMANGLWNYAIKITAVNWVDNWTTVAGKFETYRFEWSSINGPSKGPTALCAAPVPADDYADLNPYHKPTWIDPLDSVVFEGDKIDADGRTVTPADRDLFNIACAGTGLFKMHASLHTQADVKLFATTYAQRQTMLLMWGAVYCGPTAPPQPPAVVFTVPGEPLEWRLNNGLMDYDGQKRTGIESRWNENGAVCLTRPRVDQNPTAETLVNWPAANPALAQARALCGARLPVCPGTDLDFGVPPAYATASNL